MRNPSSRSARWLDIVMLSLAGVLLLPIVALALTPVLLTFMVLWPILILPILAAPRSRSVVRDEPLAPPKSGRPPRWRLPPRHVPQAA